MNSDFIKELEYCNIPLRHTKYKGEDITVFCDDVSGNHSQLVKGVVEGLLPQAKVYTGSLNFETVNNVVKSVNVLCNETKELIPFEDFIRKYNVRLVNNSKNGGNHDKNSPKAVYLRAIRDKYNLVITGSAGNGYGSPIDNSFYGAGIMVGGCQLKNGEPTNGLYAEDEDIDFTCFTAGLTGTSFSAPFLLGICGLLIQKYPKWKQSDIYCYLKNHSMDLGAKGKDSIYGYGLPIMGEIEEQEMITETQIKVDGKIKTVQRILKNGENYIRLRDFEDILGVVDVEYDYVDKIPVVKD